MRRQMVTTMYNNTSYKANLLYVQVENEVNTSILKTTLKQFVHTIKPSQQFSCLVASFVLK